jgi:transcriptional regulator with XRE-family HTH domain
MPTFQEQLRSARRVKQLTQEQLAARSGLAVKTIYRLEAGSGASLVPTLPVCLALVVALGTEFEFSVGNKRVTVRAQK